MNPSIKVPRKLSLGNKGNKIKISPGTSDPKGMFDKSNLVITIVMSIQVESDLKDILNRIDTKLDKLSEDVTES